MRKPTAYAGAGGAPGALGRRDSVYIQICSFVYPFGGDGGRNREDGDRAGQFIFVFLSLFELCECTNVSNNQMRTFDVGKQGGIVHVNIRSPSSSSSPSPHQIQIHEFIKIYLLPDLQTSGVISSSGCSMLNMVGKGSLRINKQSITNTR